MPKSLLLADDSVTIQKVVGISFASEDIEITTVDNGDAAIAKARELRPDVILADVVMPGLSGYEVCEAIKADPSLRHVPVMLLTGTFEAFDEERAQRVGAAGHVSKPFEAQTLVERVKELLAAPPPAPPQPAPVAPAPDDSGAFDFFTEAPERPATAHAASPADTGVEGLDLDEPDAAFAFGDDDLSPAPSGPPQVPTRGALPPDATVAILPDMPAGAPDLQGEPLDFGFEEPAPSAGLGPDELVREAQLDPAVGSGFDVSSSDLSLGTPVPPPATPWAPPGATQVLTAPPTEPDVLAATPPPLPSGHAPTPPPIPAVERSPEPIPGFAREPRPPEIPATGGEYGGAELVSADDSFTAPFESPGEPPYGFGDSGIDPVTGDQGTADTAPDPFSDSHAALPPDPVMEMLRADRSGAQAPGVASLSDDPDDFADPLAEVAPTAAFDEPEPTPAYEPPLPYGDPDLAVSHAIQPDPEPDPGDTAPRHGAPSPWAREPLDAAALAEPIHGAAEAGASSRQALTPEMRQELHDTLEKIAWDAFGQVTDKIVRQAIERIEQVAWEVVPKLAETLIEEEIRRLQDDGSRD